MIMELILYAKNVTINVLLARIILQIALLVMEQIDKTISLIVNANRDIMMMELMLIVKNVIALAKPALGMLSIA